MRNQPSPRSQASNPSHAGANRPLVLAAIVTLTAVASTGDAPGSSPLPPAAKQRVIASYGKLPLHFEANQGQTDERVKFLARGSGYGLFLTSTESVLVLHKAEAGRQANGVARGAATPKGSGPPGVLRMKLLGADPRPAIGGREELPGKSHYFIGNDPKQWRTNVPQYARVEYKDVYPGVSLAYYGNQGQLEYDFVVSPGADPRRIRLGIEGAEKIHVDAEGNLVLSLPGGKVVQKAPVVYQEFGGARKAVEGWFVLRGRGEVGFEVGAYEANGRLVLDPVLVYSTYLGGLGGDAGSGIAVDAPGNAYVTGNTNSTNFPTVNPLQAAHAGGIYDAFVAKVNAAGSALLYSTYFGGTGADEGLGVAVDVSGSAYVTGYTQSTNFPTANALQAASGGSSDAFIAKIGIDSIASNFFTVTPCRVADTRNPAGSSGGPALGASMIRNFPVTGVCGIPPTAGAVALIVTVVDETDFGDLRLYPAGTPPASSSTINFAVQTVRASNAIIALGAGGQIAVQCDMPPGSAGQTHFLFDVTGYFQ
jgi:hypothetical protein